MDHTVFTLHRWCLQSEPVIWLHVASDVGIAVSYLAISVIMLISMLRHRNVYIRHPLFWVFALFILLCGSTHAMGAWTMVVAPDYLLEGVLKAFTMVISAAAAIMLAHKAKYFAGFSDILHYRSTNHQLRNTLAELSMQNAELNHLIREGNRSATLERQLLLKEARRSINVIDSIVPKLQELVDQTQKKPDC